jgi:hypothetical protein
MPNGILDLIQKEIMPQFLIDNFHVLSLILPNGVLDLFHVLSLILPNGVLDLIHKVIAYFNL